MRTTLGVMVAACFYYSGLVKLARWWTRRAGKRLIILTYHRASEGNLRRHLRYLRRHYRMMHLDAALNELFSRAEESSAQAQRDKRTPLVLTFDDGYQDNYIHAFELARELKVPITIFLIPGYLEKREYFWWREGQRLARAAPLAEVTLEGVKYQLAQPAEREKLAHRIDTMLRYAPSVSEREMLLIVIREALHMNVVPDEIGLEEASESPGGVASLKDAGALPLTWAQACEMQESGWISFGAHTMHHQILACLSDPAEVQYEVEECRRVIEQRLNCAVRSFAYPVGRTEHIGREALRAVQMAGYDWAVTTVAGVNTPQSDPYLLKRVPGDVTRHWLVMAAEVAGVWGVFAPLWKP